MEVKFLREPTDNHWVAQILPVTFNAREQDQLNAFGGFLIDAGSAFTGLATFALPKKEILIPTQLPVKVLFSISELTAQEADDRASTWETTMESRLQSALTTWMTYDPTAGTSTRIVTLNG